MVSVPENVKSVEAPPPISAELWQRLRRFDPHCEISMIQTSPMSGSQWERYRRGWVVMIRPTEMQNREIVRHAYPRLIEALRLVIDEAERRGWARHAEEPQQ